MTQTTQRVAVTGAAGQIGYALLFRIASGQMFGPGVDVELSMLELEAALPAAEGVRLELDDCAFPLLKSVTISSKPEDAFAGADWALLVGAVPRKQGMERADLLTINGSVFTAQGKAIAKAAKPSCRVLVVGNPCNTNAMICRSSGGLPASQVFAMTMLDQNRAVTQLAQKAGTRVSAVQNLAIWGNHSPTMFPDFLHAKIGGKALTSVVTDRAWLEGRFLETVQQRGAEIIKARGASSAASAANAVVDSVRALTTPTPPGQFFSACVTSDGSYAVPAGLVFGYPLRSDGTNVSIVQGLEHDAYARGKLDKTIAELVGERDAVRSML